MEVYMFLHNCVGLVGCVVVHVAGGGVQLGERHLKWVLHHTVILQLQGPVTGIPYICVYVYVEG